MSLPSVTVRRKVEFADTDAAGLVHFSNYFRYMEHAERAFFERAGLSLFDNTPARLRGFPRVEANCRFAKPLHFGDEVTITLTLESVRSCALRFAFRFEKPGDAESSEVVAEGGFTTVYSEFDRETAHMQARLLPAEWIAQMGWEANVENASPSGDG